MFFFMRVTYDGFCAFFGLTYIFFFNDGGATFYECYNTVPRQVFTVSSTGPTNFKLFSKPPTVEQTLHSVFSTLTYPLVWFPSSNSAMLKWLRNQILAWAYIGLYLVSFLVFQNAQLLYNDGQQFVTFWQQILALEPFL